jgi:tryptophan 2,3-dioxygenase
VSTDKKNVRELESSIHTDLRGRMGYGEYLHLEKILDAQEPLSSQHDEMLFIIIHQASELWLKLAGHEVAAAITYIRSDDFRQAFKVIARVKLIFNQLVQSWNILSTLTPVDYLTIRESLGNASGFQSYGYRRIEFLLGNKNPDLVRVHKGDSDVFDDLNWLLENPSLYDQVLRKLGDSGFDIDAEKLDRDFTQPYEPNESVEQAWLNVYRNPEEYFEFYELAEKLVDIEDAFQQWRFRHMYTVQRIIGMKQGTGGSSGVTFLKRALETSFFPELISLRAKL